MLKYTNIKSGDTMSKNKEILNNWKNEIKEYEQLNITEAQELYKELLNCNNEKIKKQLRNKLILGTLHVVSNFIESSGYTYMRGISYDMNDIINSSIETWIKRIDSGELLNVENFRKIIVRDFYSEVSEHMGINIDIKTEEYMYYIKEFTYLVADYINKKQENPDFSYKDLEKYMEITDEYYPLLKKVNLAYYTLKEYEAGLRTRNKTKERDLRKYQNKYDTSSFDIVESIFKSIEEEKHIPKTILYNIRTLVLENGLDYSRIDINNLYYNNIEKNYDQKELREILIDIVNNCTEVTDYHKKLILERNGFNGEPVTLEKFAQKNGHNKEYARQAECRILRKLRKPSRAELLKDYLK